MKNELSVPEDPSSLGVADADDTINNRQGVADDAGRELPITVVRPRPGWHLINLREIWRYRELLTVLTIRDIKVRYRQTLFGVVWAIVPPVVMMVVFSVIFGKIAKVPTGGIPYPVFVYAGLLSWKFFTTALSDSVNSVIGASQMIGKVYFPRLILPFSRVAVSAIDFAIAFLVLAGLMIYYHIVPGWRMLFLPPLLLLIAMAAVGLGAFLAALNVSFRDVRHMIPFIVQIGLFLTPAIYMDTTDSAARREAEVRVADRSAQSDSKTASIQENTSRATEASTKDDLVPDRLQQLLHLNPMMGLISAFRAAILNRPLPWMELAYSSAAAFALFFGGCMYFERVQRNFADII